MGFFKSYMKVNTLHHVGGNTGIGEHDKGKVVWCLVVRTSRKVIMASEFGKPKPPFLMEEKPLEENVSCKNHRDD